MTFGEFLHNVRKRTKGTQVARLSNISYVYLLDVEKGARPVPSNAVLMNLASNLPFEPGERERFFDLAASENGEVPLDVSIYLCKNRDLVDLIRKIMDTKISSDSLSELLRCAHNWMGE